MSYTLLMTYHPSKAHTLSFILEGQGDSLTRYVPELPAKANFTTWFVVHYHSASPYVSNMFALDDASHKAVFEYPSSCPYTADLSTWEAISHFLPKKTSPAYKWYEHLLLPLVAADTATPSVDNIDDLKQEIADLKRQIADLKTIIGSQGKTNSATQTQSALAEDPLAAARARGISYMKKEFENPENLTLVAASEYAGRSDRVINLERNRGWLYALILEGNKRGFRYPKWQFDVPAARLRAVLELLVPSELGCWAIHGFLRRPHPGLANRSPSEVIGDSSIPIEEVLGVVRTRLDPHQGAT